jgi:hypothetical protein
MPAKAIREVSQSASLESDACPRPNTTLSRLRTYRLALQSEHWEDALVHAQSARSKRHRFHCPCLRRKTVSFFPPGPHVLPIATTWHFAATLRL